MRHLAARPAVSATYLPGDELAVTVHGRAELFDLRDAAHGELRQAMLDHYVPLQGPEFETWLDGWTGWAPASCRRRCSPSLRKARALRKLST